jgi:hypothetical protein
VTAARALPGALVFAVVTTAAVAGQPKASGPAKKGDAVTVKGCLTGGALEATDVSWPDTTGALAGGLTFRLAGDKRLLREAREEHDRTVVEVKGVLKSNLPQDRAAGGTLGRTRITFGAPAANPHSMQAERNRSLPVLDAKSVEGTGIRCGR